MRGPGLISVVIVAKNEENHIALCLESVLSGLRNFAAHEVILVDSFSSDSTIDIARRYPVRILRLRRDWFHSPAAGRFIGVSRAGGKYVLIVDGDCQLRDGYLEQCVALCEAEENLAGVGGIVVSLAPGEEGEEKGEARRDDTPVDTELLIGTGVLYRRDGLVAAGNFNPFLSSEEEADVSIRLRRRGYTLKKIPVVSLYHFGYEPGLREMRRRLARHLYSGTAAFIATCRANGNLLRGLSRFRFLMPFTAGLAGVIVLAVFMAVRYSALSALILTVWCLIGLMLTYIIRKKSFARGVKACAEKFILLFYIFKGMLSARIKTGNDYPLDAEVIQ